MGRSALIDLGAQIRSIWRAMFPWAMAECPHLRVKWSLAIFSSSATSASDAEDRPAPGWRGNEGAVSAATLSASLASCEAAGSCRSQATLADASRSRHGPVVEPGRGPGVYLKSILKKAW